MDKKWILILIILIVGCFSMYFIVESSNTVGTAITVLNKTVVTIPDDLSIKASEKNHVELFNKHGTEKIHIKDMGKNDTSLNSFKNNLNNLKSKPDINIISNSTYDINNITTYRIDFENTTSGNMTFAYLYTANHTFTINMSGYNNTQSLNSDLEFIVSTLKPDFKQSQD
ncbi:hypothetical protein [Methanobrevibacter sp.]|uniref:hypothetical protein n=1 Tax=Methanobrevibacter sp. TaxID=66852 RepID=UPI0026E03F67|nr:hypothetical protein [Methanobrevibacter sp.]MDO5823119.1 hypothetical protein [Methanobrevibacter sp.]